MPPEHEQQQEGQPPAAAAAEHADRGPAPADGGPSPHGEGHPADAKEAASPNGDEVSQDLDELIARAEKADEYLALAQRTQADFENYRKRMARDVGAAENRGIGKLAKQLLPALDNLGRALEAADGEPDHHLASGIRLVYDELLAALARVGIEAFSPAGERFDPQEHEAMAQQPVDGVESGTVVEVYQQGYKLEGTVLRPARVVVAA